MVTLMNDFYVNLRKLKRIRQKQGVSQSTLDRILLSPPGTYAFFENGRAAMTFSDLSLICQYLEISQEDIKS